MPSQIKWNAEEIKGKIRRRFIIFIATSFPPNISLK
jgi:hypothetical protein